MRLTVYRVAISWRGPAREPGGPDVRKEAETTVDDPAKVGDLLASGAPDGWNVAYITVTEALAKQEEPRK
ncbi:MAG: hypothetical protein E5X53_30820 [Mesorhizobium sp.]|uniref:hypothetical protein n=1 Tax=Mesorhizobium sp. TaxID=1871066 RepID=UPI00122A6CF3|nr:hypothetical protein [Mesorhizobium sp.]TIP69777.1 MAG: hypothetical protein E5X55_30605 [Mesorhizobium sp.]TIQ04348.1 MAG: hypothetical protein E5X57_29500 [Mesorhizobium sp.]TIR48152.1 MAG: hypothetical protein E5X53_30820 [Mesorhizobium sp.]TJV94556.1 MAG: hypothetical protein E5X52_28490 [Mesorhizobium sp.]